jgi:protein-S-isoprenylcysteine O-methyltransferase Ste14
VKGLLKRHGQKLVNLFVFATLGYGAAYRAYHAWLGDEFDFVEAVFFAHNLLLVLIVLARRDHISIDRGVFRQGVALVAFFSAIAFDTEPTAPAAWMITAAKATTVVALVLGSVTLLNLGRSFGIMIALRKVKTGGLYRIVRHPMYLVDTIWRTAFIIQNPSPFNLALYVAATACYVYRAILEERFLAGDPEYSAYMERVRYRFIPGVF